MEDNWLSPFKSGYRKGCFFALMELRTILEKENYNQQEMHALLSAAIDDLEMFLSYGSCCVLYLKLNQKGKIASGRLYEPGTTRYDINKLEKEQKEGVK